MDGTLFFVGDDLKQLERRVDQFEVEAIAWRAQAIPKLAKLDVDQASLAVSAAPASSVQLTAAIEAVEAGLKMLSQPLHADPGIASQVEALAAASKAAGKLVRKLLRRIERIRVAQHAAHIDLYYGLLAMQSELDGNRGEGERFRDPAKLGASLRSQLA